MIAPLSRFALRTQALDLRLVRRDRGLAFEGPRQKESMQQLSTKIVLVPLNKLIRSPLNARKTGGESIDDLAASLLAHGLLHNLTVINTRIPTVRPRANVKSLLEVAAIPLSNG